MSRLIKRIKLNDDNQIQQNANSSAPGTMITTTPEVSETTMVRDHNRPILDIIIAPNLKTKRRLLLLYAGDREGS